MFDRLKLGGLISFASAVLWIASLSVQNALLPRLSAAPGVDLIFVPSGIRLILVMIGGAWAAAGLTLGSLVMTGPEFGTANLAMILPIALCTGLCPFLSLRATQWAIGMDPDLHDLRPSSLPIISLGVAAGSSVMHNLLFLALGLSSPDQFVHHVLAMALGDFTGSLVAVAIFWAVLRLRRKAKRRGGG